METTPRPPEDLSLHEGDNASQLFDWVPQRKKSCSERRGYLLQNGLNNEYHMNFLVGNLQIKSKLNLFKQFLLLNTLSNQKLRGGATKKREISRTLLSINLHFSVQ